MKVLNLFPLILLLVLSIAVVAQEPADQPKPDAARIERDERPRLLELLGVSDEQKAEIQRLNQERRPKMQAAQQRLRESVRSLDIAIYGETVNDAGFAVSLREHQEAQAEVARLRFEGELEMRKLLTPEQLVRFRQLRRQFNAERQERQQERRLRQRAIRPSDGPRRQGARPLRRPIE